MRIIGFNFTKILIEKKGSLTKPPQVKTSINVLDLKEISSDFLKAKETPIEIKFSYGIFYEPKIAELAFEGNLIVLVDPKDAKEIIKKWKKKDFSEKFKLFVFNVILRKSNIRAIQLEDEMNLPPHFQLPSLKFENKENKEKKKE